MKTNKEYHPQIFKFLNWAWKNQKMRGILSLQCSTHFLHQLAQNVLTKDSTSDTSVSEMIIETKLCPVLSFHFLSKLHKIYTKISLKLVWPHGAN